MVGERTTEIRGRRASLLEVEGRLRDKLEKAVLAFDADVGSGNVEEAERLRKALDIAQSLPHLPKLPLAVIALASVSLLLVLMPTTTATVYFTIDLTEFGLTLTEPGQFAPDRGFELDNLSATPALGASLECPGKPELSVVDGGALSIQRQGASSHLVLGRLAFPREVRLGLVATEDSREITLNVGHWATAERADRNVDLTAQGPMQLTSGATGAQCEYTGAPLQVAPLAEKISLGLAPTMDVPLLTQVLGRSADFEAHRRPGALNSLKKSSILAGAIEFDDVPGKKVHLRRGERFVLEGTVFVNSLVARAGKLVLSGSAEATVLQSGRTLRNLMPTRLEYWQAQDAAKTYFVILSYVAGVVWSAFSWRRARAK